MGRIKTLGKIKTHSISRNFIKVQVELSMILLWFRYIFRPVFFASLSDVFWKVTGGNLLCGRVVASKDFDQDHIEASQGQENKPKVDNKLSPDVHDLSHRPCLDIR